MATIQLTTFNARGTVVAQAIFTAPANIDPMHAQERAAKSWVTLGTGEEVWMDMRVNGKLVNGCDL